MKFAEPTHPPEPDEILHAKMYDYLVKSKAKILTDALYAEYERGVRDGKDELWASTE